MNRGTTVVERKLCSFRGLITNQPQSGSKLHALQMTDRADGPRASTLVSESLESLLVLLHPKLFQKQEVQVGLARGEAFAIAEFNNLNLSLSLTHYEEQLPTFREAGVVSRKHFSKKATISFFTGHHLPRLGIVAAECRADSGLDVFLNFLSRHELDSSSSLPHPKDGGERQSCAVLTKSETQGITQPL